MSFFDQIALGDINIDENIQSNDIVMADVPKGELGDVVVYDKDNDVFRLRKDYHFCGDGYDFGNEFFIGIVLRILTEDTVDVMMSSFLMNNHKSYPYGRAKTNQRRKYMYDMFERYSRKLKNFCKSYPGLFNMRIDVLNIDDIKIISDNRHIIFRNVNKLYGVQRMLKFKDRLFDENNCIFCRHNNIYYVVSILEDGYEIKLPKCTYDFLCVFRNLNIRNLTYI